MLVLSSDNYSGPGENPKNEIRCQCQLVPPRANDMFANAGPVGLSTHTFLLPHCAQFPLFFRFFSPSGSFFFSVFTEIKGKRSVESSPLFFSLFCAFVSEMHYCYTPTHFSSSSFSPFAAAHSLSSCVIPMECMFNPFSAFLLSILTFDLISVVCV